MFFQPQGLGKAAMLFVSKPSYLIKKRQIFSHIPSPLAYFGLPDSVCPVVLLISLLLWRIRVFVFFSPSATPASACSDLCFTSSSPFTYGFPISQGFQCNLVPTLVLMGLVWTLASPISPCIERGHNISQFCQGSAGLFLQKLGP